MKKLLLTLFAAAGMVTSSQAQTALNFDGNDDIVVVGNSMTNDLVGSTTFSVEAWVNTSSTSGNGVIVGNYNYPTNNSNMQFLLRRDGSGYKFSLNDGNGYQGVSSGAGTVITGQWQHIAGTWDGTSIRIYVDGVELGVNGSLTGPGMPAMTNEVVFGNNAMPESFSGSIDNVRIWNVQRSAADIATFMDCEVKPNAAGLIAAYHFNDGIDGGTNTSNTLLFDNSGNGYNGTLENFALTGTTSNFVASDRSDYMSIQAALGSSAQDDRMGAWEPADFNGDGHDDLLISTQGNDRDIYYNDGLGHFDVATPMSGTIGNSFAVGDIDNDGDVDIVNYSGAQFKVYVNDGAGNFTEQTAVNLDGTGNIIRLRIADLNGDGLADIVTGNGGTNATDLNEIWINNGTVGNPSFTFLEGVNYNYTGVTSIAVGDIDDDGDIDLAFGGYASPVVVFTNDNNTTFTQDQAIGGYHRGVRFIDWNQDGHLDLVTNDDYNNWGVRVRYNDGTGTFSSNVVIIVAGSTNLLAQVQYADMNGDGFLDVISRHWGGNGRVYLSNGCELTEQTACSYKLGPADNNVVVGDFNSDGKPDVFCAARDKKSSVSLNFLDPVTTPDLSQVTSTTGDEVCDGDQVSVEATVSNTGTINWYSDVEGSSQIGSGSPYSPTAAPGTYTFYVHSENPNGCVSLMDSVEVIVNENPEVALNTTNSVTELDCFGDTDGELNVDVTLNGTATTSTYEWDDASTSTTQNLTGVGAGTYSIVVTDDNGCTATTNGTITEPDLLEGTANATDVLCNGDTDGAIDLTVSGGTPAYSFVWDDAATSTTQNISGLEAGTYSVDITDDNGCVVNVSGTVSEPDAIDASTATTDVLCNGGTDGAVDLTVTGGTPTYSFVWDDAATSTTQNISGLEAGTYSVDITDDNGCTANVSGTVSEPDAIDASATTTIETLGSDGAIDLTVSGGTAPYSYEWTGPNGFTSTDQNPQDLVGGTYEVTITDDNGCTFTLEVIVDSTVGLKENTSINFNVYPNPSNGKFTIESPVGGTMEVINNNGQVIRATTVPNGKTEHQLTHLAQGVYSVRLTTEYGVRLKKLVIQ